MTTVKLHKKIYNIETGIETITDLTSEEVKIIELQQAAFFADLEKLKAEQASKNAAKQAVLDKIGLSADEVAALLG